MKYIIITILSIVSFVLFGCTDFLDKDSLTNPSANTYWRTKGEAESALLGCYYKLREPILSGAKGQSGNSLYWDALSDNALTTSNWEGFDVIMKGDFDASSTAGPITKMWKFCFQGIAQCNFFLKNVDKVPGLEKADYERMKGEALFLRAYYYNELAQLFGAVPLTLEMESLNSNYQSRPRTPKKEVVTQILDDLDKAIEYLPNVSYTDGHAVRGSAIALKVRVLLNNDRYSEAAESAWTLIGASDNPFALHNNYAGIFWGEQSNNKEIMFSVQFKAPDDYHSLDQVVGGRMAVFPTIELSNAYEANDPRKKMSIFEEGDTWAYSTDGKFGQANSFAEGQIPFVKMAIRKYVNTSINNASGATTSDQHFVKIRYADLLLMFAEAMFESGQGSDERALKALNDVRQREGVMMPKKTELTREIIRNERRIELAFEGLRYSDLIRWKIADEVIPVIAYDAKGNKRKFKSYLFPVPLSEMDKMQGVWEQNEDYLK